MKVECICPQRDGQPRHPAGDTITLRDKLGFRGSLAAQNAVYLLRTEDPDASTGDVLAALTESYLLNGVESWTLVGEDGKPIEVTKPAIREHLLTRLDVALEVAEEADTKYREDVIAPLVKKAASFSSDTSNENSTSPTSGTDGTNLNHSSPSSISTTPMDDTETTSLLPAGASSSSQN
jgi:hypothetical protein